MLKKITLLIVFVLALGILPTFAQEDPYADVDPSGQTVTYWHNHTGGRARALDVIVRVFNDPMGDWATPITPITISSPMSLTPPTSTR